MSSAFSMLAMLGKRRASAKRTASQASTADDNDAASVTGRKQDKKNKKATLLSRTASSAIDTIVSRTPERPSTPAAEPVLSESPKIQPVDLKSLSSDDFSVLHHEEKQRSSGEGEWTELAGPVKKMPETTATVVKDKHKDNSKEEINSKEATEIMAEVVTNQPTAVNETLAAENALLVKELKEKEDHWAVEREREAKERVDAVAAFEQERERAAKERVDAAAAFEQERERAAKERVDAAAAFEQERERAAKERVDAAAAFEQEKAAFEQQKDLLTKKIGSLEIMIEDSEGAKKGLQEKSEQLRKERDAGRQSALALQEELSSVKAVVAQLQGEARVQGEREEELKEEASRIRRERDADLAVRDDHIHSLNTAITEARTELNELRESVEGAEAEKERTIAELSDRLSGYYQHVEETERRNRLYLDQMKRQSMEVRFPRPSERRYLVKATEPIDAGVRVLNTLNSEIFQAAASFADSIEANTTAESELPELQPLIVKLAPMLSEEVVTALRFAYTDDSDVPNPLLLQVAFQACMTYCCNRFVVSWYPMYWDQGDFLQILYSRILETGKTEIAESWRSTTKTLLRLTSESHPQLTAYLREHLYDILSVIGRSKSSTDLEALLATYEEKLSIIARLAIRLHILFSDSPCNLATYVAQPGSDFHNGTMDDTYAEDDDETASESSSDLKRVICTSDIGLQRLLVDENGDPVVVKSRVVLAGVLNQEW